MTDQAKTATIDGVSRRYAIAFFELAQEAKNSQEMIGQLQQFVALLEQEKKLASFLTDPRIAPPRQQSLMNELTKQLKTDELLKKFFLLLLRQRRFYLLGEIFTYIRHFQIAKEGEIEAEVISAQALVSLQQEEVKKMLAAQIAKNVQVHFQIDQNLIAGMKIKIGSRVIDASLQSKLARLQQMMRGVG